MAVILKKKNTTLFDQTLIRRLTIISRESAAIIKQKMETIYTVEYIQEKQRKVCQEAEKNGLRAQKAKIDRFEYLSVMTEPELQQVLLGILPVVKIEEKPAAEMCKYMIGTTSHVLQLKANKIMLRVGGGYSTLVDFIKQNGPFECIKIYKQMKGDLTKNRAPMHYTNAVEYYLKKHMTADKIV